MTFSARSFSVGMALVLSALGCTHFSSLSAPPPGRVAELDNSARCLRISRGVALAFRCTTWDGNPCARGRPVLDDATIAEVHPAFLDRLEGFRSGIFVPASYVLVGLKPGKTLLRIPGEAPLEIWVED